jgi:hypothetical protein
MTLPDYSPTSGFYNPRKTYTGYLQPEYPVHNIADPGGMNPTLYRNYATGPGQQAEYERRLTEMGITGQGSKAKAARQLYGQAQSGYEQAKLRSNYNLFFPEYLDQVELDRIISSQSYDAQGLNPGRFGQRKYRWGMRGG